MLKTGILDSEENEAKIKNFTEECITKYQEYTDLSIFTRTAYREELEQFSSKKKNACNVCQENLNKSKQCMFCGHLTCKNHLIKKRKAPVNFNSENSEEFVKICRNCENKYIELEFIENFSKDSSKWKTAMEIRGQNEALFRHSCQIKENNIAIIQQEITFIENDSTLVNLKSKTEDAMNEMSELGDKIKMLNVNEEGLDMNTREISHKNEQVADDINELTKKLEDTKNEKYMIENQIKEVEKDLRFQMTLFKTQHMFHSTNVFTSTNDNQIHGANGTNMSSTRFYDEAMTFKTNPYEESQCEGNRDSKLRRSERLMVPFTQDPKPKQSKKNSVKADTECKPKKKFLGFCC